MTEPKVALVTGATSGIGRATAIGLGKAGYRVAILGRREEELKRTAELSDARYSGSCDVSDPAAVHRYFSDLKAKLGRIDVVFNNAGMFAPQMTFGDMDIETWKRMVDVNLNGAFYVAREAFRAMRDQHPQGGRVINNGSISAYAPRPNSAPYTSTKHAITGLTKTTSLDGRKYDIACSQIDIGNAATEMTERMTKGVLQPNGEMMVEPRMDVQHVANAIVHIANLPLDANVQFMTIMATKMPFVGRG